jgi:hypothetical protein
MPMSVVDLVRLQGRQEVVHVGFIVVNVH